LGDEIDILALMEREEERRKLVRGYEILGFEENPLVPCRGVIARLDAELGDVVPVLFLMNLGRASYIPGEKVLTIKEGGRLITFYPDGRVSLNRAWTEEVARQVLDEVVKMVNEAYAELLRYGPPNEEELRKALSLSWKDVLDILPGENCGKCGRETCHSFAIDVLRGKARLSECTSLIESWEKVSKARRRLGHRIARALGL